MEESKRNEYVSVRGLLDTAMFQMNEADSRLGHFLSEGRTRISQKEVDGVRAYLKSIAKVSKQISLKVAEFELFTTERFEDEDMETAKKFTRDNVVRAVGIDEF